MQKIKLAVEKWHCYYTIPIDYWLGWETLSEFIVRSVGLSMAGLSHIEAQDLLALFAEAVHTVSRDCIFESSTGPVPVWDGSLREGPYVAFLDGSPPRTLDEVAFAWKQDSNGTTFFVAQVPLPIDEDWDLADAPQLSRSIFTVKGISK